MASNIDLNCSFCKKDFKSKTSLDFHQKNTKSCLEIQGKINDSYKCEHCDKILCTQARLNSHIEVCKVKLNKKKEEKDEYIKRIEKENKENKEKDEYIKRIEKENKEKDEYIKRFEQENKQKLKENEEYIRKLEKEKDDHIKRIEKENEEYKTRLKDKEEYILKIEEMLEKATNSIVEIAKQPKNITNTNTNSNNSRIKTQNNIQNNFDINDIQKINNVLENHLTPEVLTKGQKGVAEMLKTHLLQTDNGDLLYECTDVARQKFEFVNKDGWISRN